MKFGNLLNIGTALVIASLGIIGVFHQHKIDKLTRELQLTHEELTLSDDIIAGYQRKANEAGRASIKEVVKDAIDCGISSAVAALDVEFNGGPHADLNTIRRVASQVFYTTSTNATAILHQTP